MVYTSTLSLLKNSVIPRALFMVMGFPKDGFGSIDVTGRCNLRCKHCYFYAQEIPQDITDEQWLRRCRELASGVYSKTRSVTWVGGEPLLRKDLIEKAKSFFSNNLVVTNGLIPLPDWPDVSFHISLDGDEKTHEVLRNKRNIYQKIKNHARRPELDVTMVYCISSENMHCVEKVLDEWKDVGVRGFLFSFYTPFESIEDPLFPGWGARDRILDRLIELKHRSYGDFIQMDTRVLELMKRDNAKSVTDRCLFLTKGVALDTTGRRKAKCMMGDKADCDRCGCMVPFYLSWRTERKKILRDLYIDTRQHLAYILKKFRT